MQEISKKLTDIRKDVPLAEYTSFKIGGLAKYFIEARTKQDTIASIKAAEECNLPFFVLSGGSNLLIADKGYQGLVIKVANQELNINDVIHCGAGLNISRLVNFAAKNGLTGMEWAVGIPGTIGGAIYGNAGAFKCSMADVLEEVEIFNGQEIKTFQKEDCLFSYRSSIFKKDPKLIILTADFKLTSGDKKEIVEKMKEHSDIRIKAQPYDLPSAGSVFKNPTDFSAGYLIEQCGFKGKKLGGVKVSEKHANFIVNSDSGTAEDVLELISLIRRKVKEKFGITLEQEIQYLN